MSQLRTIDDVGTIACIGAGTIGGGWAAYFLARMQLVFTARHADFHALVAGTASDCPDPKILVDGATGFLLQIVPVLDGHHVAANFPASHHVHLNLRRDQASLIVG